MSHNEEINRDEWENQLPNADMNKNNYDCFGSVDEWSVKNNPPEPMETKKISAEENMKRLGELLREKEHSLETYERMIQSHETKIDQQNRLLEQKTDLVESLGYELKQKEQMIKSFKNCECLGTMYLSLVAVMISYIYGVLSCNYLKDCDFYHILQLFTYTEYDKSPP